MNDAGYTLSEVLAALLMIGLAMTGFGEALHVFTGGSLHAAAMQGQVADQAKIRQAVGELPTDVGPFGGADQTLTGSPQALSFACGLASVCSLAVTSRGGKTVLRGVTADGETSVTLSSLSGLRLSYLSAKDGSAWSNWPNGRADDRLAAVAVYALSRPVAVLRFAKAQRGVCAFDVSFGNCRSDNGSSHAAG